MRSSSRASWYRSCCWKCCGDTSMPSDQTTLCGAFMGVLVLALTELEPVFVQEDADRVIRDLCRRRAGLVALLGRVAVLRVGRRQLDDRAPGGAGRLAEQRDRAQHRGVRVAHQRRVHLVAWVGGHLLDR